ncbi:MAG: flagellar hook-basal body complex protein FliE [Sphingomonadales bacterium]|jgi:flagellar hook-basal body complex protein FliE
MLAGIGGAAAQVLALRQQILARNSALAAPAAAPTAAPSFQAAMADAVSQVNAIQAEAGNASAAFERGDSHDLASVMIARQKAALAFEATVQVRNRLLGAYKDVMNMPL